MDVEYSDNVNDLRGHLHWIVEPGLQGLASVPAQAKPIGGSDFAVGEHAIASLHWIPAIALFQPCHGGDGKGNDGAALALLLSNGSRSLRARKQRTNVAWY